MYCSDVAGAFDRVFAEKLMSKLARRGVPHKLLADICSWLQDSSAVVIIGGVASSAKQLRNSVYQGTVWGPPLWNCHYEDARLVATREEFVETVFADDLNCYKPSMANAATKTY